MSLADYAPVELENLIAQRRETLKATEANFPRLQAVLRAAISDREVAAAGQDAAKTAAAEKAVTKAREMVERARLAISEIASAIDGFQELLRKKQAEAEITRRLAAVADAEKVYKERAVLVERMLDGLVEFALRSEEFFAKNKELARLLADAGIPHPSPSREKIRGCIASMVWQTNSELAVLLEFPRTWRPEAVAARGGAPMQSLLYDLLGAPEQWRAQIAPTQAPKAAA